jgi:3-oxoacyl-[acyl-carrier-protein] synthase-3
MTGIQTRHYLGQGESLQGIAASACLEAIQKSSLDPSRLDMMIFYTDVPPTLPEDGRLKKTYYEVAPHIQYLLRNQGVEVNCECINIGGSCVAFISSLQIACGLIKSGIKKNVLVVGAADCSSFLAGAETNVAMTFSDGAAATILTATQKSGFIDFCCLTDGSGYKSGYFREYEELHVDRKRVAEFAPRAFQSAFHSLLEKTNLDPERIDLVIPHQAGLKIIERGTELAGIPREKVYICLQSDGNTGAPAIQIALTHALEEGRIHEGDLVALIGFGTGWHYGATAFYYHENPDH